MANIKTNNRLVIVKMEDNLLVLSLYVNGLFVKEAAAPWDAIPNQESLQKTIDNFREKS